MEFDAIKDKYEDGTIRVDARVMIEELEKYYNCKLLDKSLDIEIDTLGGLIFHEVGRVPREGELIKHFSGLTFDVVEADMRRIKKVKIMGSPKLYGSQ